MGCTPPRFLLTNTLVTISSDFYLTLRGIIIDTLVQIPGSCVRSWVTVVHLPFELVGQIAELQQISNFLLGLDLRNRDQGSWLGCPRPKVADIQTQPEGWVELSATLLNQVGQENSKTQLSPWVGQENHWVNQNQLLCYNRNRSLGLSWVGPDQDCRHAN